MGCKFCGVLPEYGHFDWCKVERAPTAEEILLALLKEAERSVDEGPSSKLVSMCESYFSNKEPNV
jgi:hypothetical protein